jgi:hypothetical protein
MSPFVPGLPRGACRDFWANGSCSRGFTCSYQHLNGPGQKEAQEGVDDDSSPAVRIGADIYPARNAPQKSPGEVHTKLKTFLASNFEGFRTSLQVYLFLECINSARISNSSWVRPYHIKSLAGTNLPSHFRKHQTLRCEKIYPIFVSKTHLKITIGSA